MSNPAEQLVYNPDLVGEHMYAITKIEKRQPFTEAPEALISKRPMLYQAGILAVQGCLLAQEGQRHKAVAVFDEGRDVLQGALDNQEQSLAERIPYEQLDGSLNLYRTWARPFVWKSRREQQVLESRVELQAQTVLRLGEISLLPRSAQGGVPTELVTIALLERQMHPWLLSTHALPHHDQGATIMRDGQPLRNRNFDVLTTQSIPNEKTRFFRLQCKTDCLGICHEFYGVMNNDSLEARIRARHRAATSEMSVKEISGCCDLDIWNPEKRGQAKDTMSMLVREQGGETSEQDILDLDELSSGLTLTASLPKRITESNKKFPLTALAKREFFHRRQEARRRIDAETRRITAETRRETARAGIARIMNAREKAS
jgi:hypothetical protein